MKKLIIILIVIIGLGLIYYYFVHNKSNVTPNNTPPTNSGTTGRKDPSSATFIVDDEEVTLSAGVNSGASGEETALLDKFAYGDLNGDGKQDTALFLVRSGGGSGVFIYLAAFVSGPLNYKGSEALFLGDRISPQSISINGGVVTVKYLDRKENEPLAAEPTLSVTKQFTFKNNTFVER